MRPTTAHVAPSSVSAKHGADGTGHVWLSRTSPAPTPASQHPGTCRQCEPRLFAGTRPNGGTSVPRFTLCPTPPDAGETPDFLNRVNVWLVDIVPNLDKSSDAPKGPDARAAV